MGRRRKNSNSHWQYMHFAPTNICFSYLRVHMSHHSPHMSPLCPLCILQMTLKVLLYVEGNTIICLNLKCIRGRIYNNNLLSNHNRITRSTWIIYLYQEVYRIQSNTQSSILFGIMFSSDKSNHICVISFYFN